MSIPTEPQTESKSGLISQALYDTVQAELQATRTRLAQAENLRTELQEHCYENWSTPYDGEDLAEKFGIEPPSWSATVDVMIRATVEVTDLHGTEESAEELVSDDILGCLEITSTGYGNLSVEDIHTYDSDVMQIDITNDNE